MQALTKKMTDSIAGYAQLPGFFLVLLGLIVFAPAAQAADATFSWLPNGEANLAGYKIHYGTTSRSYGFTIDVGNPALVGGRIQAQLSGMTEGTTYYVAATAYDTSGLESDYSTEVVWTAPSQAVGGSPPVASAVNISTPEDQTVSGIVTASNDTGLPVSYLVQQGVTNGTLLLITNTGSFTYTPLPNFTGTDSFTFLARDDNGNSNTAMVSITVTAVNDPPTAENAAITVSEDSVTTGQLQAHDPENDSLTYSAVVNPSKGALLLKPSGAFTYTPIADTTGADHFTFWVSDGLATSNTATVNITIAAINDLPIAKSAALTVTQNATAYGQLLAQDPENDSLSYSIVTNPARGSLVLNPSGVFTYTPNTNTTGTDHFTFRARDGQAASNTATISITILSAPVVTGIFSWLPNQENDLAGYKIHYGTASNTYNSTIDVGNPPLVNGKVQAQVTDLVEGITYYFSITAYNTSGRESFFSTEIVWLASSPIERRPPTPNIIFARKIK